MSGSLRKSGCKMVPYRQYEAPETREIAADDGTKLFVRRWPPFADHKQTGTALLVHGLGEHGGRYGHVAHALNELGIDVWAHDHRGFGKSSGARAKIPADNTLLDDTKLVFDLVAGESHGTVPIVLGHSMGGAIAARAVTGGWIAPRALVLSSPGLKSYLGGAMRSIAGVMRKLLPNIAVPHGLPLEKISHDADVLAESKADPLNHALISPRITMFIVEAGEAAIRDAAKLNIPVLLQVAGDDKLVDPSGSKEFAARIAPDLCTLKIYEGLWHEVYNEREHDREAVLADLKSWISSAVLR